MESTYVNSWLDEIYGHFPIFFLYFPCFSRKKNKNNRFRPGPGYAQGWPRKHHRGTGGDRCQSYAIAKMVKRKHGYGSKLGTPIIGWLIHVNTKLD